MPANNFDSTVIECACKALGHFAAIASTTDMEFVEEHFYKPTVPWLNDSKSEMRRLTAVCILQTLLDNAPALFYANKTETLKQLFGAIKDSKLSIR